MQMKKYKVLKFGHIIVDTSLLLKGIYEASTPRLFPSDITMEGFTQELKNTFSFYYSPEVEKTFMENLTQCHFADAVLFHSYPKNAPLDPDFHKKIGDALQLPNYQQPQKTPP